MVNPSPDNRGSTILVRERERERCEVKQQLVLGKTGYVHCWEVAV
jgi:hypothetical protein